MRSLVTFDTESKETGDEGVDPTGGPIEKRSFLNLSGSTIAEGDWVELDTAPSDTSGPRLDAVGRAIQQSVTVSAMVIGVANQAIPDGEFGEVQTYGYRASAAVATGITAPNGLRPGAVAGQADVVAAATDDRIGILLTDEASNVAEVFILCS